MDWVGSPLDRISTYGYCVLIRGNLISWRSKKQNIVVRSSVKAKYHPMAATTYELMFLRQLLLQLKIGDIQETKFICDNQATLYIASNSVFHKRTKHIEIDCYFVREKVLSGEIAIDFVNSSN